MSAGQFSREKYEVRGTNTPGITETVIVPIRVQPETVSLVIDGNNNDAPAGSVTLNVRAKARKGNTEYGIGARNITVAWTAAPPAGYEDELLTVPILTPATFDAIAVDDTGTYLGAACIVVSKKQEQLR